MLVPVQPPVQLPGWCQSNRQASASLVAMIKSLGHRWAGARRTLDDQIGTDLVAELVTGLDRPHSRTNNQTSTRLAIGLTLA